MKNSWLNEWAKTALSVILIACAALWPRAAAAGMPYIESDGSQVIDLGFQFTNDMTIGLLIQPLVPPDEMEAAAGIVGARGSNANDNNISAFFGYHDASDSYGMFLDFNNGSYSIYRLIMDPYDTNSVYGLTLAAGYREVKNTDTGAVSTDSDKHSKTIKTPSNALLFGIGGPTWNHAKMRFYEMEIVQNGVVTHHFVPAVENGVVGVRDEKDSTIGFRTSEIGNPLVSGSDSDALSVTEPRVMGVGIRELDYIESDGTQYIDTELAMNSTMSVLIDFALLEMPQSTTGIFGVRDGSSVNNISSFLSLSDVQTTVYLDYTPSSRVTASAYALGMMVHRSVLHMTPSRRTLTLDDGTVICDVETKNLAFWSTPKSAHIFKVNAEDNFVQNYVKMRLYRLRIVNADGVPLRDYVPCLGANDKAGLYDSVTGKVSYPQEGGNDFAYGSVVSTAADESQIRAHATVKAGQAVASQLPIAVRADFTAESNLVLAATAYVESDSSQFIDLGFKLSSDMVIDLDFMPLCNDATGKNNLGGLFGARTAATNRNIEVVHHNGALSLDLNYNYGSTDHYRTTYLGFPVKRYLAHIENGDVNLRDWKNRDPPLASSTISALLPFETEQNAHLFDSLAGGSWTYGKMRFYDLKITQNGELVHHFVPAVDGEGRVGVRDTVPGGCGFCCPTNSGANPLTFVFGEYVVLNSHTVSAEVRLNEVGEQVLKVQPLKPGVCYRYVLATTSAGTTVTNGTGAIVTPPETFGEGGSLAVALPEEAPKPGKLEVLLERGFDDVSASSAVTAYFGTLYGDADPAKWENAVAVVGTFAAGEQLCRVTLKLPKGVVYVRFKTAEGAWSPTVFIPETQFTPPVYGLMIIVR